MSNLKSPTTYGGGIPGLAILAMQASAAFDGNPLTIVDPTALATGIGLLVIGLYSLSMPLLFGQKKG